MGDDEMPLPWGPESEHIAVLDARLLRALSHPMRNRIVMLLRQYGPSTATRLATRLGVNSGATSYHLRQLADAGLVEEDAERGNARDRWWRAVHRGTYLDDAALLRAEPETTTAYLQALVQLYAEAASRAVDVMPTLSKAWIDASNLSQFVFYLTARQTKQMRDEIYAILAAYTSDRDDPHPRGSRRVSLQLQLFPEQR